MSLLQGAARRGNRGAVRGERAQLQRLIQHVTLYINNVGSFVVTTTEVIDLTCDDEQQVYTIPSGTKISDDECVVCTEKMSGAVYVNATCRRHFFCATCCEGMMENQRHEKCPICRANGTYVPVNGWKEAMERDIKPCLNGVNSE